MDNKTGASGYATKISGNILLSSRKIGNAILKKFAPEANAYEIASDWLAMKSYIFVFDDIERCDCPLNEVFGFINGLVEHEGTKVILVANEKEISLNEIMSQRELQYSLALNDKILWPAKDEEVDAGYRKIREKLIGVTLHYQPDIKSIIKKIKARNCFLRRNVSNCEGSKGRI